MEDANAAAQLMMTNPIRSFNELLETFGKEFSGDALYKKVIEKTKEMLGKVVTPRTVSEAGGCFAAGTLVHTKEGLKPIEQIQVGDWVLSKPESGEGEQAYKRVARTFSFEDKAVVRIKYSWRKSGEWLNDRFGGWQHDVLIVTGNHPFWVPEIDKSGYSEGFLDHLKIGWTRADELFPGALIELITGEQARVTSSRVNCLWKTTQPDLALESRIDSEEGYIVSIKDGSNILYWTESGFSEYLPDDDTFTYRGDDPEQTENWTYRTKVYNFEVEDFHTYYVGNLGAWVHNTNCYGTTVDHLKKNGVLPSIDGQAFFTEGQVAALVNEMIAQQVVPKGMVLVKELVTKQLDATWVRYQRGVEGGLFLGKAGDESFFARSLIYLNEITGGRNVVKLGDGAAYIYDGLKKILSKTTIDAKSYNSKWAAMQKSVDLVEVSRLQAELVRDIARTSSALKQNPGFSHVIEFASNTDLQTGIAFFKQIGNDPTWAREFGPNWLSKDIYLAYGKETPGVKRILSDYLVGFTVKPGANGTFELIEKAVNKKDVLKPMEQNQGFLADIKKIFGDNEPGYQLTESANTFELTTDRLVSSDALSAVLAQAKVFWLQHGALASVLNAVELSIEPLPSAAVAQTIGKTITLSPDAAGWGWFVDATPAESEEFTQIGSSQDYRAQSGSGADGKIDLLGVMIHELGHVLGLEHSDDAGDEMAATVTTGLRRLPDLDAGEMPYWFGASVATSPTGAHILVESVPALQLVMNPVFASSGTVGGAGWTSGGYVAFDGGFVTLSESPTTQTTLSQAFTLGAGDRYLSFTVDNNQNLASGGQSAPSDAFEVALLDATTYDPLLGKLGLTHSDALLNLQRNASGALVQRETAAVHSTTNADGSTTYTLDLRSLNDVGNASGIGRSVLLSFDLLGFGATDSTITLRNIHMSNAPQAVDDALTVEEDTPTTFTPISANLKNTI